MAVEALRSPRSGSFSGSSGARNVSTKKPPSGCADSPRLSMISCALGIGAVLPALSRERRDSTLTPHHDAAARVLNHRGGAHPVGALAELPKSLKRLSAGW